MNTNYTTDTTKDYTIISLSPMQIDLSISYQQSLKDEQKRIFYDAPLSSGRRCRTSISSGAS